MSRMQSTPDPNRGSNAHVSLYAVVFYVLWGLAATGIAGARPGHNGGCGGGGMTTSPCETTKTETFTHTSTSTPCETDTASTTVTVVVPPPSTSMPPPPPTSIPPISTPPTSVCTTATTTLLVTQTDTITVTETLGGGGGSGTVTQTVTQTITEGGGGGLGTVTQTVTSTAPGTTVTSGGECNTGSLSCCNSVVAANSTDGSLLLGLLGIVLTDLNVLLGVNCSPLSVIGIGGTDCTATPVCCAGDSFNGLINIGCSPIIINF